MIPRALSLRLAPLLLPLLLSLTGSVQAQTQAQAQFMAPPWNGEYFDKQQGAFYLKMELKGFPASAQTKFLTGSVQVSLYNILSKRSYLITHTPRDPTDAPKELWKLPSGKYDVVRIVMVDTAGVRRAYEPRKGETLRTIVVKRLCVSNLGLWTVSPTGEDGLTVRFGMMPNSYREDGDKAESSVAAVLDGYTGLIQEKLGGKRVLVGAERNYEEDGELRATVTFTRQISMFFKLDLLRHNYHAGAISQVLQVYDANLRRCYTDRLELNDALKGEVKFTFLLSKTTGTMAKLKHTGGSANDPKLAQCIYLELAQIQFPVPENMIGQLTYIYDVR